MKAILLTTIFFSLTFVSNAQTLEMATSSGGGGELSSASYKLQYSIGQSFVAHHHDAEIDLQEGIFQSFENLISTIEEYEIAVLELAIFPNPSSDFIVLDSENYNQLGKVIIYDSAGIPIRTQKYRSGNMLDVQNLFPGNYVIVFETSEERKLSHFVKL